jgi:hypothetical protein
MSNNRWTDPIGSQRLREPRAPAFEYWGEAMDTTRPTFCAHCETEMKSGDQRWSALEPLEYWHYECAEAVGIMTIKGMSALSITSPKIVTTHTPSPAVFRGRFLVGHVRSLH